MLFKTRDVVHGNGFIYLELPTVFHYEILQEDHKFSEEECMIIDPDVSLPVEEAFGTPSGSPARSICNIKAGTKNLYFQKEGILTCHFFLENGWIIDKKNQTVETL